MDDLKTVPEESHGAPERGNPGRAAGELIWYATLSLVMVFLLSVVVITAASVSPTFCLLCHSSSGHALSTSSHADIKCDSCHTQASALGLVESRMRVVSMVFSAPFMAYAGGRTSDVTVDNGRCLECHAGMMNQTISVNGLRMNHRAPEAADWSCSMCHLGASHPSDTVMGASYTMDQCLQCHSAGPENLATCESCHEQGTGGQESRGTVTPWRVTHGENWQQTHGMGDLNTCKTCHAPEYCVACHNMQLPHAANFLANHGATVLARATGDKDCVVCHKGSACENCHGLQMPHPDGFIKTHPDASKETPEVCERCHSQAQCDACHTRHTHPGIPEEQLKLLKENPVSAK